MQKFVSLLFLFFIFISCNDHLIVPINEPEPSGMDASMQFWYYSRSYPDSILNTDQYEREWNHYNKPEDFKPRSPTDVWTGIGPKNFAGRTLQLAFNPLNTDVIWAVTAGGGLWKSTSGGRGAQAWTHIETGFPVFAASAISVNPLDSNELLLGTGEVYNTTFTGVPFAVWRSRGTYGIGILKSTDGSRSWKKILTPQSQNLFGCQVIKYDKKNPLQIYAGTTEGLYRSEDGGKNWSLILNQIYVSDLLIHESNPTKLVCSVGNLESKGRGIYHSDNGGISWVFISDTSFANFKGKIRLTASKKNPDLIFASVGSGEGRDEIYRSTNFGKNWQVLPSSVHTYYWIANDIEVVNENPLTLLNGGVECFLYDVNKQQNTKVTSWFLWYFNAFPPGEREGPETYVHADLHDILVDPNNPNRIYLATDGGVFLTLDGAKTFTSCNGGLQTTQFYMGCSNSETDSLFFIGGLQDNATTIYKGQAGWEKVIGGDGGFTSLDSKNPKNVIASVYWCDNYLSKDGGMSFTRLANPPFNYMHANFISPIAQSYSHPARLYTGGDVLYRSLDYGLSWQACNGGAPFDSLRKPAMTIAISKTNPSKFYISSTPFTQDQFGVTVFANPARLFKSEDAGISFENISLSLPDRLIMDMFISPINDDELWVCAGGFGTAHVFHSLNGGVSWTPLGIQDLPDVPFNAIIADPIYPSHIYVGTDIGCFVSLDNGTTWKMWNEGMWDAAQVYDLVISPSNRKIRMATYGKGVFERDLIENFVATKEIDVQNLFLYPNPCGDQIRIMGDVENLLSIEITDLNGKVVYKEKTIKNASSFSGKLNLKNLQNGVYRIALYYHNQIVSKNFIKER